MNITFARLLAAALSGLPPGIHTMLQPPALYAPKPSGHRPRRPGHSVRQGQRMARKRRNVLRHRRACRGAR